MIFLRLNPSLLVSNSNGVKTIVFKSFKTETEAALTNECDGNFMILLMAAVCL